MEKHRIFVFLSIFGVLLASCGFKDEKNEIVWSKWHDNGDGTHSRHSLKDITVNETEPHTFTLSKVLVEPTDVTPGKEVYKCELCGATENRDAPPTGNYVFDQKVMDPKYLYEKCSDHSAIYYMSSKEGAYGNPNFLFEDTSIGEGYTEVEYIESDGSQFVDTGLVNSDKYTVSYNDELKNSILPSDYQKVEYIETSGTQYIDTNYLIVTSSSWEVSFELTNTQNGQGIAGERSGLAKTTSQITVWEGKIAVQHRPGDTLDDIGSIPVDTNKHTISISQGIQRIDGSIISNTSITESATETLYIGARSGVTSCASAKYYSFKILENSVMVRNFVPAYRKADNVIGFYETYEGKFYTNAGTGEFAKGNNVFDNDVSKLPSTYQEVEFVESDGNQRINSKILLNPTDVVDSIGTYYFYEEKAMAYTGANWYTQVSAPKECPALQKVELQIHYENNKSTFYANGSLYHSVDWNNIGSNVMYGIFALGNSDGQWWSGANPKMKLFDLTIFKNGQKVGGFVPCYRKNDDVIGLYDTVTSQFFTNEGTGSFEKGSDINAGTRPSTLPGGYYQLEYIESTGLEYIDTGIIPNQNTGIEVTFSSSSFDESDLFIFGAGTESYARSFEVYPWSNSSNWSMQYNYGNDYIFASYTEPGENDIVTISQRKTEISCLVNGTSVYSGTHVANNFTCPNSLLLFAITRYDAPLTSPAHIKMRSCKIYDDTSLIRDLVPASNGASIGLYDKVTAHFFTNDGGGSFIAGPINNVNSKLPVTYQEVEYIQKHGNQFIDTGLVLNYTEGFKLEATYSTATPNSRYTIASSYNTTDAVSFEIFNDNKTRLWCKEGAVDDFSLNQNIPGFENKNTSIFEFKDNHYAITCNGESREGNRNLSGNAGESLFIFVDRISRYNVFEEDLRIYSLKIWCGESLARNYIPCYSKDDGEIGLYDLVNDTFSFNGGQGELLKGDDINNSSGISYEDFSDIERHPLPESYHQLAYVKSFGNVNVGTGVFGNAKVELTGAFSKINRNQIMGFAEQYPFGFGVDSSNKYFGTNIDCGGKDLITYDCGYTSENKVSMSINGTNSIEVDMSTSSDELEFSLFSAGEENGCYYKLFECKIYQNNQLIRHFVPAKNIYLKTIGLYELKENKFYESRTTGRLDGGSDLDVPADSSHINLFISRFSNENILNTQQIQNCKIYNSSNEIVRDFVPVLRNSDGKPGFFDVKGQKFYTNSYGNEFKYGKKIGHHFDEGVIEKPATHAEDGSVVYTCSICGEKVYEKTSRLSYKVEFKISNYIEKIRIFSEVDPSKYEESLIGYTRNIATYNYSRIDAMIYFEVITSENVELIVTASNGNVKHVEGNRYRVTNIMDDCIINVSAK